MLRTRRDHNRAVATVGRRPAAVGRAGLVGGNEVAELRVEDEGVVRGWSNHAVSSYMSREHYARIE